MLLTHACFDCPSRRGGWHPLKIEQRYTAAEITAVTAPIVNQPPADALWQFVREVTHPITHGRASYEQLDVLFDWFVVKQYTPDQVMDLEEFYDQEFWEYLRVHWFQLRFLTQAYCAGFHWARVNDTELIHTDPYTLKAKYDVSAVVLGATTAGEYVVPWSSLCVGSTADPPTRCSHPFDHTQTVDSLRNQRCLQRRQLNNKHVPYTIVECV